MHRRTLLLAALAAVALPATAEDAIRLVVGFPAGASSDTLARLLAAAMAVRLGRPVIVDNRPGAGTRLSAEFVKQARPDGQTLLVAPVATMSIFPSTDGAQLRYDPFHDFVAVTQLSQYQLGAAVASQVPVRTLRDYVAWVRQDPARNRFYGITAVGSLPHLFAEKFGREHGLGLTAVPFKGTTDAMQALANGDVAAIFTIASDLQAMVEAGRARLVAVGGSNRAPGFGDVPTFREQGFDIAAQAWHGLFAPAGTPPGIVARLAEAAMGALREPAIVDRLHRLGLEATGHGPSPLAALMRDDFNRWAPVVQSLGAPPKN